MTTFLKPNFRVFSLPLIGSFVLIQSAQAVILIDDFNNTGGDGSPITLEALGSGIDTQLQTSPLNGSISNDRFALLDDFVGVVNVALVDQINPDTANGYISFGAAQAFSEADLEFSYLGLGGIDLTGGGANDSFQLFVRSASQFGIGDISWAVGVEDTVGTFEITSDFTIAEGYNSITLPSNGVDYSSVEDIHLYVNASSILAVESVQFDNFQVVPEPGAFAAVAGLLAMGFGVARRRRRA